MAQFPALPDRPDLPYLKNISITPENIPGQHGTSGNRCCDKLRSGSRYRFILCTFIVLTFIIGGVSTVLCVMLNNTDIEAMSGKFFFVCLEIIYTIVTTIEVR